MNIRVRLDFQYVDSITALMYLAIALGSVKEQKIPLSLLKMGPSDHARALL